MLLRAQSWELEDVVLAQSCSNSCTTLCNPMDCSMPGSSIFHYLPEFAQIHVGGSVVKNPPANAGNMGLISASGRTPGEGNGNPLQYSCLGNPMDGGAWWTTVHEVTKDLDSTWQLNNSNNILTYSRESIRPCTCTGMWGCLVKTEEGPKFSPLVLFDVLYK